jgi:hypothetical protein
MISKSSIERESSKEGGRRKEERRWTNRSSESEG